MNEPRSVLDVPQAPHLSSILNTVSAEPPRFDFPIILSNICSNGQGNLWTHIVDFPHDLGYWMRFMHVSLLTPLNIGCCSAVQRRHPGSVAKMPRAMFHSQRAWASVPSGSISGVGRSLDRPSLGNLVGLSETHTWRNSTHYQGQGGEGF